MKALCDALYKIPEMAELLRRLTNHRTPVAVCGVSPIHAAHIIASVRRKTGRPVVVVTADEQSAARLLSDTSSFSGEEAFVLPGRELSFYQMEASSRGAEQTRISALAAMAKGGIAFATAEGLMLRTMPPKFLADNTASLSVTGQYDPDALAEALVRLGYKRVDTIEPGNVGTFAMRGGIVDVFAVGAEYPVRMELFGDMVDSMGVFDPETQRRLHAVTSETILPAAEFIPDDRAAAAKRLREAAKPKKAEKYREALLADADKLENEGVFAGIDRVSPFIYGEFACGADYIPHDAVVFIDDSARTREKIKGSSFQWNEDVTALLERGAVAPDPEGWYAAGNDLMARLSHRDVVTLDLFTASGYELPPSAILSFLAKSLSSYAGSVETAASDIRAYTDMGYGVLMFAGNDRLRPIQETLAVEGIEAEIDRSPAPYPESGKVVLAVGRITAGFEYPSLKLAVLTEGQLAPTQKKKKRESPKKTAGHQRIQAFTDLVPGDLVVHDAYGIGRFSGIERLTVDGLTRDYIRISYHGTDSLLLPATQLDSIAKYIGAGEDAAESRVKLSKLGSADWSKTRAKAKSAAKDLAKQLIELYAARQRVRGFAFPDDNEWQKEFEDSFEYDETDDQLRTTAEIKRDMEKPVPMDRLLCGDVGFGKTEVAFRAVMKCVMGGKQAALLVPTTVLARQHYNTAVHRFRGYPLKIGVLSRFTPPARMREYQRGVSSGAIDLIIGTHKLLSKDLHFHDLGLVIVDEEQRFGVSHKEKLKELAKNTDVLTLTATPIPRTLNMALSGIRDMSVLEEAPRDRRPVQTYVLEHDWGVLADAMRREVARGGQVYYLHNRVETISRAAAKIKELLPDASVGIAHGKMDEEQLNEVMRAVTDGEIQILVCTTIIETGVDIPNVNTLIIDEADKLGLAQLHQIRGRVGRSSRRAFAYLTFRPGRVLTEVASKRLAAIREFAEFGAGFKIAMRDLEIRGAGNVLGSEQSGHMMSVGYDMYLRLLEEAVVEEKGETPEKQVSTVADIAVSAFIPEKYIPSGSDRMDIYRRIAYIRDSDDMSDMTDELLDRYGEYPAEVDNLMRIAMLRSVASRAGVSEITAKADKIVLKLTKLDDELFTRVSELCGSDEFRGRVLLNAGSIPYLTLRLRGGEDLLECAEKMVNPLSPER